LKICCVGKDFISSSRFNFHIMTYTT
jgi:hypothetical protein